MPDGRNAPHVLEVLGRAEAERCVAHEAADLGGPEAEAAEAGREGRRTDERSQVAPVRRRVRRLHEGTIPKARKN